jgi:GNAT superfamily N-acetyltransferase
MDGIGETSMPSGRAGEQAIVVRPVDLTDLNRISLRCWPDRPVIERLFAAQGTIGMAAWEHDTCVGVLHCYQIALPQWQNDDWPEWNAWYLPTAQPESAVKRDIQLRGMAWAHACVHVGRTLAAAEQSDDPDPRYLGRGIGTALCRASVQWAREHGYIALLAPGAPAGLIEFARWTGHLPWTTYARSGFVAAAECAPQTDLPGWACGNSPPDVMAEIQTALASARKASEFHERLMILDLRPTKMQA